MAGEHEVLLIGERDLLATIASSGTTAQAFSRPLEADPAITAFRASALGPELVVVFGPQPGELEAIAQAGPKAIGWPHDWYPVADELFSERTLEPEPALVFFSGAASKRRDNFLQPVKHRFDVLHLASGADLDELKDLMGRCTAAIDLAPEPGLTEVDRIGPALAAGMLLLAEGSGPREGLANWNEFVAFTGPDELSLAIADLLREPGSFVEVRARGRQAAESWRTSTALRAFVAEASG